MRSFWAIAGGLIGYVFLEGFIRVVIMFYHRMDFHFYGVEHLPQTSWIIAIYLVVLINSWLITMLILSITNRKAGMHALIFACIMLAWRVIEIANSYGQEPTWYLFTIPIMNLLGIFLAYKTFQLQHETPTVT